MSGHETIEGQGRRLPPVSRARKVREKKHQEEAPGFGHGIVAAF